ncbi:MAG: hypothetical protein LBK07_03910 [Tannerella sp.]|jgi:predicted RecA/RadA family phage recombinase|nr:hypothetical protein [Tannerella sp.]
MNSVELKNRKGAHASAVKWMKASCLLVASLMCTGLAGCGDDDPAGKSGSLAFEGKSYAVHIRRIDYGEDGNLFIEMGCDLPTKTTIRNGTAVAAFDMKVDVGGRTYEAQYILASSDSFIYYFATSKPPKKITVYSNDGSGASISF